MPAHPGQKDWLRPCNSGIDVLLIWVRDASERVIHVVHELRKVPVQPNPDPPQVVSYCSDDPSECYFTCYQNGSRDVLYGHQNIKMHE